MNIEKTNKKITTLRQAERGIIMELINTLESKVEEVKDYQGDIFIISDGDFISTLEPNEYAVYCAFLALVSYHNGNGQHFIYEDSLNWTALAKELELKGRTDKSIMKRDTIRETFNSLVEKKVFKPATLDSGEKVYYIIKTDTFKFTRMKKQTFKRFTKTLNGNALKVYVFLKGNLDNIKANGGNVLYMNRETIATYCGIFGKDGKVGERQLKTVGTILATFKENFGLLEYTTSKRKVNGSFTGIYEITKIKEKFDEK